MIDICSMEVVLVPRLLPVLLLLLVDDGVALPIVRWLLARRNVDHGWDVARVVLENKRKGSLLLIIGRLLVWRLLLHCESWLQI